VARKSEDIRSSMESTQESSVNILKRPNGDGDPSTFANAKKELQDEKDNSSVPKSFAEENPSFSEDILEAAGTPVAVESSGASQAKGEASAAAELPVAPADHEALLQQLRQDYETSQLQRQEEIHDYVERIDALQAKLLYLSKESAGSARKASTAAASGSLEKKIAEKEEQIALLMQEGQTLSKMELKHMTAIKKLRAKIAEDAKQVEEAKNKQAKAEKELESLTAKLRTMELSQKNLNERLKSTNKLQKEFEVVRAERDAKDSTIKDLKIQLEEAAGQAKRAEMQAAKEALETEKKKLAQLEEDFSNLKVEKELAAERANIQIKELREQIEKEVEKRRATEMEMKTEQQMLESKLEVMRARAEEVSSGATGDAQAKLLRQIETLQSQYAVASDNWQGIESTMVARITGLEKERDELVKKEADVRRKARELVTSTV
jgi:chromosome segregation ATPase